MVLTSTTIQPSASAKARSHELRATDQFTSELLVHRISQSLSVRSEIVINLLQWLLQEVGNAILNATSHSFAGSGSEEDRIGIVIGSAPAVIDLDTKPKPAVHASEDLYPPPSNTVNTPTKTSGPRNDEYNHCECLSAGIATSLIPSGSDFVVSVVRWIISPILKVSLRRDTAELPSSPFDSGIDSGITAPRTPIIDGLLLSHDGLPVRSMQGEEGGFAPLSVFPVLDILSALVDVDAGITSTAVRVTKIYGGLLDDSATAQGAVSGDASNTIWLTTMDVVYLVWAIAMIAYHVVCIPSPLIADDSL